MDSSQQSNKYVKRIGELLIEMGFITEKQLQDALDLAKEKNMKIGEALLSMGILNKDHIYWVLGNQLDMDYIELNSKMVDENLLNQFSLEELKNLKCIPLYEINNEIHFAISDPNDQQIITKIQKLIKDKTLSLHLALPEKITDILNIFQNKISLEEEEISTPKQDTISPIEQLWNLNKSSESSLVEFYWKEFIKILLLMQESEIYILFKSQSETTLLLNNMKTIKKIYVFPKEFYEHLQTKLLQYTLPKNEMNINYIFFEDEHSKTTGLFVYDIITSIREKFIIFKKVKTFSEENFLKKYPKAEYLSEELVSILIKQSKIIVGGDEMIFIKSLIYWTLISMKTESIFSKPIFFEKNLDLLLPEAIQIQYKGTEIRTLYDSIYSQNTPYIFMEFPFYDEDDNKILFSFMKSIDKNIITYLPSENFSEMQKVFLSLPEESLADFKMIFLSPDKIKCL